MAKLSSDGKYVTVDKGDTLSEISQQYYGGASNYKKLAALNNISNHDLIYVGQTIRLTYDNGGSGGSVSPANTSSQSTATITAFGLQADSDGMLYATWSWNRDNTDSYKVVWTYWTEDGVRFIGNSSSISYDKEYPAASEQSTYTIPSNAAKVSFKVKPISKTYTQNDTETSYWTAGWSTEKTYNVSDNPPTTPEVPRVTVDKYRLTAELDNLDVNATSIQFQVVKNDTSVFNTGTATITLNHASYSCTVEAGNEYKVRCRSCRNNLYSDWSEYSENVATIPSAPSGITVIRAASTTSVYLEWAEVASATSYDIEYTTKADYFDKSDSTTVKSGIEFTRFEITGLETGDEYFFRVRAVNDAGESYWSGIKSVVIGTKPSPPTTWSSTTKAITGEDVTLYWVHNTKDGSKQEYAQIELIINGWTETHTIRKSEEDEDETEEDDEPETGSYTIDTANHLEGSKIEWRVRTSGITDQYSDWSVQRVIDVYAPPTLEVNVTDLDANTLEVVDSFPFRIYALAGPDTQAPIGYHLTVTANETYETVDNIGNTKTVKAGDSVYSKYFDVNQELLVEMSANNIDLENNISYTVTCVVSMNSGLTAQSSTEFRVSWNDRSYIPSASIGLNRDRLFTHVMPYCKQETSEYRQVEYVSGEYRVTDTAIPFIYILPPGSIPSGTVTTTGETVYMGETITGEEVMVCKVLRGSLVNNITLSVYRREFDGSFTELATGLTNNGRTFITDPHPALDYARYRIVATNTLTGEVGYYDVPGYPVGEKSVIIQWDEDWTRFEASSEDVAEQPAWSGSMLKLPYNIDVSDKHKSDVSLIEYIGRKRPVSYYGTQLGETATWNVEIEKSDKETLYALRRLAIWMGDVYVREPSGSGYWANVSVSFSQKHRAMTIPVSLEITRVEGGV